jgi:Zn-dependent metalloprotease
VVIQLKKYRLLLFFFSIIVISTINSPINTVFANQTGLNNPTLLNANSKDLSHFSQSKHKRTGKLNFLSTKRGYAIKPQASLNPSSSREHVSRSFLSVYGKHFGLNNEAKELIASKIKISKDGRTISRFKQIYNNIPVFGGELVVDVDSKNNLRSINGNIATEINVSSSPTVSPKEAETIALEITANTYQVFTNTLVASKPELIILNAALAGMNGGNINLLAWKFVISTIPSTFAANEPITEQVFIDANNKKVITHFNLITDAKNRTTYDFQNRTNSPVLLRSENSTNYGNIDIDNAHNFAGDTYDFYKNEHNRDSINNAGMTLISKVHYSSGYCNAYWNGFEMTYGDGCFIVTDDVVAHELTHGVTQYESSLIYQGQSGAINEAFSDIWGEFVDLTNNQGTDTNSVRWLMGEDTSIGAIRNMKNPSDFQNPDRIKSSYYYCGTGDNSGVHYNSGVANKAAYLITDGGDFNGYSINGLGISKTADLFYEVQTNILSSSATYSSLYGALNQACSNLNYTISECLQVNNAGLATQMNLTPCEIAPCNVSVPIVVNSSLAGLLASTDCLSTDRSGSYQDVITFDATEGRQYTITLNSTTFDAYLYLLNGTAVVAYDDDSNGNYNSKIIYTATATAKLTIHATSYYTANTGSYIVEVTSIKANQTISFGAAPDISVKGNGIVSATATSGLQVDYSSLTPSYCSISGTSVNGLAVGDCIIAANQVGSDGFNSASQVTQTIHVSIGSQTILFDVAPSISVNGTGSVSATASSGLAVSYSSRTLEICTIIGSTVTGISAGTCEILARQTGNGSFDSAPELSQTFTITKSNQVLSFGIAPSISVNGTGSVSATASSRLAVSYTSGTSSVCTINGSNIIAKKAGTCSIFANQPGDESYNAAEQVVQSFLITKKAAQFISFGSVPNVSVGGLASLTATASSGLPVKYSSPTTKICNITKGIVRGKKLGACTIIARQSGNNRYNPAPNATQKFTILN